MRCGIILLLASLTIIAFDARASAGADETAGDEQVLAGAGFKTDTAAVVQIFQKRTLSESEATAAQSLIQQLGADSFEDRQLASAALIELGPKVNGLLRQAVASSSLEVARRAESCLRDIHADDISFHVLEAGLNVLTERADADALETMLAYLPLAEVDGLDEGVRDFLVKKATTGGKVDPRLVAGLTDKNPAQRAACAEALCRAGANDQKDALRKMLDDPAVAVRYRIALALAAQEPGAIPVLIDALPSLTLEQAWHVEDILLRLAPKSAPDVVLEVGKDSRARFQLAWKVWWDNHAADVTATDLRKTAVDGDRTLVLLLDEKRVVELNSRNQPRWQIANLSKPLDIQLLSNDRLLVTEYEAGRISERTLHGEVLWEKWIEMPQAAQRLPNGNLFVITDQQIVEFDRSDRPVMHVTLDPFERVMKATKLPSGDIACLTTKDRVVLLDPKGKEIREYPVAMQTHLLGGRIQALPDNHLLIPQNAEHKVVEYDADGKVFWQVEVKEPVVATRLPNGNTLVTTMQPDTGVIEFNRQGEGVWSYKTSTRVTRALRH